MNIFVPMEYTHTSLIKEDWTAVVQIKDHLLGARPLPHNIGPERWQTPKPEKNGSHYFCYYPHCKKGDCIIHPSIHPAYIIAYKTLYKMSIDLGILPCRACGIVRKRTHACKQIRCRHHSLPKVRLRTQGKSSARSLQPVPWRDRMLVRTYLSSSCGSHL